MIQKKSWLNVSDNTNVNWLQTFHLYKGFKRRSSTIGFFIKGSARVVEPPRVEYKGFKFKFNKKGNICRGLLVRTAYTNSRLDGATASFYENSTILIKKKQNPKSKYIFGPTLSGLKRKKFKSLFKSVV
jgi:large subunit ribosomal protein L14